MLSTRVTNDLAQQACIDAHIGNGLDRCLEARTIALRGKPPVLISLPFKLLLFPSCGT